MSEYGFEPFYLNEKEREYVAIVEKFLNANYPCEYCYDQDNCPGNSYEAAEIILDLRAAGIDFGGER